MNTVKIYDRIYKTFLKRGKMKERIKRDIFFVVIFFVVIGVFWIIQSKLFYINNIEIQGTNEMLKKDIIIKLEEFKNKPITDVNINILEEEILKDARVKDVKIIKKYPSKLIIQLNERKPAAYIIYNDKLFVIDSYMNIFTTFEELKDINLPTVSYNENNKKSIENILNILISSKLYPLCSELYESEGKYIITLEDGVNIYVKDNVNVKKLNQGYIVYNKEKSQNNSMEYIDLRFELISVK